MAKVYGDLKRKTFYYKSDGVRMKRTILIPAIWQEKHIDFIKQIFNNLEPDFIDRLAERNILTYCIVSYINGYDAGHYIVFKETLKNKGIVWKS